MSDSQPTRTPRTPVSPTGVAIRAVWIVVLLIALVVYVAGAPPRYAQFLATRQGPNEQALFAQVGLSGPTFLALLVAVNFAASLGWLVLGLFIARRKWDNLMAMLISLLLIAFPINEYHLADGLGVSSPVWDWINHALRAISWPLAYAIFILFPDGRFPARWTRWAVFGFFVVSFVWLLFPETPINAVWETTYRQALPWSVLFLTAWYALGIYALVSRYRKTQDAVQKQQMKWAVFGLVLSFAIQVVIGFGRVVQQQLTRSQGDPMILVRYDSLVIPIYDVSLLIGPICLTIAILKYRLWDIDVVINRSLVYSILSVAVFCLYASVVFGLNALFGTSIGSSGNFAVSVVAAGVTAISFQPLHLRIRRAVNRLMYGRRDEPYAVIARLGRRLAGTLTSESVLSTIVETIGEELKLPYAGIALRQSSDYKITAEYHPASGAPPPSTGSASPKVEGATVGRNLVSFPITYQSEVIAHLLLAPRWSGEPLSDADRRLLEDIAQQAGPAVHDYLLADDLQRSRERLVIAREDERRHIRRQLHDGLVPALAGQVLKLDEAQDFIRADPASADAAVQELKAHTRNLISGVRALAYELRPPSLDDLGLVAALQSGVASLTAASNSSAKADGDKPCAFPTISFDAPEMLPPLPAAVEAAVYRIAMEAVTNVVRHARACNCLVRIEVQAVHPSSDGAALAAQVAPKAAGWLIVEVNDDGIGLQPRWRHGVGTLAMRERAEELGGTLVFGASASGGACVTAGLPI